jgi:acetyl esterase/lipase
MTTIGRATFKPVQIDPELQRGLHEIFQVEARPDETAIDTERRRRVEWHESRRRVPGSAGRRDVIAGVPVIRYGLGARSSAVLVWLHGGGWVYGEAEGDEEMLRTIAHSAGVEVVGVDYRLAPEHPYPAALGDVSAVVRELLARNPAVIVAGASAGATLAAGVCLVLRDRGEQMPSAQILITPPLDDRSRDDDAGPLRRADMDRLWSLYLGETNADAYAAPARAPSLHGLPRAHVFTTSADPMRVEGWRYATRLAADGVEVTAHFIPGGYHGFEYEVPDARLSQATVTKVADAVRAVLSSSPR